MNQEGHDIETERAIARGILEGTKAIYGRFGNIHDRLSALENAVSTIEYSLVKLRDRLKHLEDDFQAHRDGEEKLVDFERKNHHRLLRSFGFGGHSSEREA